MPFSFQLLGAGCMPQTGPIIVSYSSDTDWFWGGHEPKLWAFLLDRVGKAVSFSLESIKCTFGSAGSIFLEGREILSAAGKGCRVKQS